MALMTVMAQRTLRTGARAIGMRRLDLCVEGLEHLPRRGPLLIASRHAHHLYDGCALLMAVPRPLSLLVALDWVTTPRGRRLMEWACDTAQWPVVLRAEMLGSPGHSAYSGDEAGRYLRHAARDSVALLRAGRALVVFPEGYAAVDPHPTPKAGDDAFLLFRPGAIRIAEMAQRDDRTRVPIVPVGLYYRPGRRWQATLRFAAPLYVHGRADRDRVLQAVEEQVRLLSTAVPARPDETWYEKSAV